MRKMGKSRAFPCAWGWLQEPPTSCLHPPGWLAPSVAQFPAGWVHPTLHPGTRGELLGMVQPDEARRVRRHRSL